MLAAQNFFAVAMIERSKANPGPAEAARVLLETGKNSVMVSIQFDREKMSAAIALAGPEFVDVLSSHEMKLSGPLTVAFADPQKVSIIDLAKMN